MGTCRGAVNNVAIVHISCETCGMAMEQAHKHAQENAVKDGDGLLDLVDGLCSTKKKEGRWVSEVDIAREGDDAPLTLERTGAVGHCKSECLAVQRACQNSLKGKEETIVSLLLAGNGPADMKKKVCKKVCDKKLPSLGKWSDEPFRPRNVKDLEAEERVQKMEAETGQKFKMWSRDEIASMSEADIELEAAKDALGAQRREVKLREQAEKGEL